MHTGIGGTTSDEVSEDVGLNYPTLSYANGPAAYLELQSLRETGFRRNLTEEETSEFVIKSVSYNETSIEQAYTKIGFHNHAENALECKLMV